MRSSESSCFERAFRAEGRFKDRIRMRPVDGAGMSVIFIRDGRVEYVRIMVGDLTETRELMSRMSILEDQWQFVSDVFVQRDESGIIGGCVKTIEFGEIWGSLSLTVGLGRRYAKDRPGGQLLLAIIQKAHRHTLELLSI